MKVLIVGGAGYIGSHTVYEFVRDNHDVVVIDNLSTGDKSMVHKKATFYKEDIRNKEALTNIIKLEQNKNNFDVVIHFAAKIIVPESVEKPLEYYHNNVEGVRVLLEVMKEQNIKNIVFSSTAAVYGNPIKEICKEDDLTKPINPYGESKLASEKLIQWASNAYNMNYCIFRYFNVAGADKTLEIGLKKDTLTHLIPITVQTLLGIRKEMFIFGDDYDTIDGTCIRDYIHVSDLANAHLLGAKYIKENNKSLLANLGSNKGFSVMEVVNEVSKHGKVNYTIKERRPGDPAKLIASNKKAKEILGWKPIYGIKEIIKSDIDFRKKLEKQKTKPSLK